MQKRNIGHIRTVKLHISMCIHSVLSITETLFHRKADYVALRSDVQADLDLHCLYMFEYPLMHVVSHICASCGPCVLHRQCMQQGAWFPLHFARNIGSFQNQTIKCTQKHCVTFIDIFFHYIASVSSRKTGLVKLRTHELCFRLYLFTI